MAESQSLKELSRLLRESKTKITSLNAEAKAEGVIKEDYENRLIAAMDAAGTETVKNEHGTFGRTEAIMPVAKDWEAIHDYVRENDAFHLLYRKLLATTYRELLDAGEEIPGVESYTNVSISVRKPSGK